MEISLTKYSADSYALRIKAPAEASRVPNHFIILLDNSGSMGESESIIGHHSSESSKMTHVKRCLDAMLGCLSADDMLSIITFESASSIDLQCMTVTDAHKAHIQSVIQRITPEDMTNLSAGLGNVRTVLAASPPTIKTGILLLTDGHINQGITDPTALKAIIQDITRTRDGISFHCIAYGNDHNDGLLKDVALETQGSYNIVNSLEDVATAFGDTLGGLMSCAAQNVKALLPADARVEGPLKTEQAVGTTTGITVRIGDLYAGTERIILYSSNSTGAATVQAHIIPLLIPTTYTIDAVESAERCIDIELTRLRYTCSDLLQRIQTRSSNDTMLESEIEAYVSAVADEVYNESPLINQLRSEVALMRRLINPQIGETEENAVLSQHISYYALGRGFSTPVRPSVHARFIDSAYQSNNDDEDPPIHNAIFQNHAQRMVSNTLRSASNTLRLISTNPIQNNPYSVVRGSSPPGTPFRPHNRI
jgi:Mg-chelatase subunit ChlD